MGNQQPSPRNREGSQTNSAKHFVNCEELKMIIEDFNSIIESRINDPHFNVTEAMENVANKYGISPRTAYTRFRTLFHDTPVNYVRKILTPEKEKLESLILNTNSVKELWEHLGRDGTYYTGLFDDVFGVSTYKAAKNKILKDKKTSPYVVTRDDNRSLIYSQLLGDGYYNASRHALRIAHGIKQTEYLKAKVAMLNKAYPELPTEVRILTHSQGYQYCTWYSKKLGNIDIPRKEDYDKLVEKLTPVGWLLWWLDDGDWAQNIQLCICNEPVENKAIEVLQTYGIQSRKYKGSIFMCGETNDIYFYKMFIEPLSYLIPNCMKYKVKI